MSGSNTEWLPAAVTLDACRLLGGLVHGKDTESIREGHEGGN